MNIRLVRSLLLASATFLLAGAALADPPARRTEAETGYGYVFQDDPLAAGGLTSSDARITFRPGAFRSTLIRPRTNFVPQMLRSVENL